MGVWLVSGCWVCFLPHTPKLTQLLRPSFSAHNSPTSKKWHHAAQMELTLQPFRGWDTARRLETQRAAGRCQAFRLRRVHAAGHGAVPTAVQDSCPWSSKDSAGAARIFLTEPRSPSNLPGTVSKVPVGKCLIARHHTGILPAVQSSFTLDATSCQG